MSTHRRDFLNLVAGSVVAATVASPAVHAQTAGRNKIRAVAFDGFPIIDPRPVFAKVEEIFPDKAAELSNAWRPNDSPKYSPNSVVSVCPLLRLITSIVSPRAFPLM